MSSLEVLTGFEVELDLVYTIIIIVSLAIYSAPNTIV